MRRALLPALLACLSLVGCAPTTVDSLVKDQGARQMPGPEVLQLVKGNTLELHSFNENAHLFFEPSGKIFAKNATSSDKDKGHWDVTEGGALCFRMDAWWYGDLRCFSVYAAGNKYRLATGNGVLTYTAQQQEGDSKASFSAAVEKKNQRRSLLKNEEAQPAAKSSRPALTENTTSGEHGAKDGQATIEYMARNCPGCSLAGADLGRADLVEAQLAGADLHGANLSMANLRRANLQKANLQKAVMAYANLPGADLRGADLRGASLKGANLIKADLTGAKLEGADLSEVLREGVKGL